ncbi:MAG: hypothetical protein AAGE52_22935 [Myxococcota bacterium]
MRALFLVVLFGFACDDGREDFERFVAEEEAREAAAAAVAAAAAAATPEPEPIALADQEVAAMGLSIRIPEGSRALQESAASTTYSLPLPGGLHEINVQLRGYGEASLERARADATMLGGTVAESATLENGAHEVVLAPQGVLQRVFVHRDGKSVKCSGPREQLTLLREICGSLQPAS